MNLRPVRREDADALYRLLRTCADAAEQDEEVTPESVARQFDVPGLDIRQCMWVLPKDGQTLKAVVSVIPLCSEGFEVLHLGWHAHPSVRSLEFQERLVRFAEERAPTVRTRPDLPAVLHAGVRMQNAEKVQVLQKLGYQPVRWFLELSRPLREPFTRPIPPAGYSVGEGSSSAQEIYTVAHEAFQDHWSQPHITLEQFGFLLDTLGSEEHVVHTARTTANELVGVCLTRLRHAAQCASRAREAEIALLAVLRAHRRKGLATCLLHSALQWARAQGCGAAVISVDSENWTGADRLYRKLGFVERSRSVVYRKSLS